MIHVCTTHDELKAATKNYSKKDTGLVPTMGNLHTGHISLILKSVSENKLTIVTIFVNPKQFGPKEDFNSYPRTLEQDIKLISDKTSDKNAQIIVFSPKNIQEVFPAGYQTNIEIPGLGSILCGKDRPTHFSGVTTVVYRLFMLAPAINAYFGLKDYQQFLIIKKMAEDLLLETKIIGMPIIRDTDGLALSSRNSYLKKDERLQALQLPKTINSVGKTISKMTIKNIMIEKNKILEDAKAGDKNWSYLELLDAQNLLELSDKTNEIYIGGAYKVGTTRLIDNLLIRIS